MSFHETLTLRLQGVSTALALEAPKPELAAEHLREVKESEEDCRDEEPPAPESPGWGVIWVEDGESPEVSIYRTWDAVKQRILDCEGRDGVMLLIHGQVLMYTEVQESAAGTKHRYIQLPQGCWADIDCTRRTIKPLGGSMANAVADLCLGESGVWQTDFWVGQTEVLPSVAEDVPDPMRGFLTGSLESLDVEPGTILPSIGPNPLDPDNEDDDDDF